MNHNKKIKVQKQKNTYKHTEVQNEREKEQGREERQIDKLKTGQTWKWISEQKGRCRKRKERIKVRQMPCRLLFGHVHFFPNFLKLWRMFEKHLDCILCEQIIVKEKIIFPKFSQDKRLVCTKNKSCNCICQLWTV